MAAKFKFGKILVVAVITVLIWVWADLSQDELLPDRPATVFVDESSNPKLLVSLEQGAAADIRVTLSGPHALIAEESRKLKEGGRLEFDFDATQEKMAEPGTYSLNLLPLLQKDRKLKRLGLRVESCVPATVAVNVVELIEKSLAVKCVDEQRNLIKNAVVEPAQVNMRVPKDWVGDATVKLARREIEQARHQPIEKRPFVELRTGQIRDVPQLVKVSTPRGQDRLGDYTVTATLGFSLSANLQGKYKIRVDNLPEVISAVAIKATSDAKRAYENMRYQVILEIDDADAKSMEPLRKELIYNFPDEYVRKDEIVLNQQPVAARFTLMPLSSSPAQ